MKLAITYLITKTTVNEVKEVIGRLLRLGVDDGFICSIFNNTESSEIKEFLDTLVSDKNEWKIKNTVVNESSAINSMNEVVRDLKYVLNVTPEFAKTDILNSKILFNAIKVLKGREVDVVLFSNKEFTNETVKSSYYGNIVNSLPYEFSLCLRRNDHFYEKGIFPLREIGVNVVNSIAPFGKVLIYFEKKEQNIEKVVEKTKYKDIKEEEKKELKEELKEEVKKNEGGNRKGNKMEG